MFSFLLEYFGYLRWIILFGVGTYYIVNWKNNSQLYKPFHLFLIVFTIYFYWIPQGLDISDEGYVLTKSWFMLHGMWHQNIDMTWGSTLLNGLWLNIAGAPNVLWARIGYVLIISLIITFSYKTLILNFDKRESFIIVAVLGLIAFSGSPQTISYQNLPVLTIVTGFFYFIKATKTKKQLQFVLSGLCISVSVMLRFPNILLASFLFIYFFIKTFYTEVDRSFLRKALINYSLGFVVGLLFGFIVLLLSGSLIDFYANSVGFFEVSSNNTHSSINLLKRYKIDLWRLFTKAIVVGLPLFGISLIGAKDKRYILKLFIVIFSAYFAYFTLDFYGDSQNWVFLILSIGIISLIIYFILKNSSDNYFEIIYCSLLLYFISFIGSNNGMYILFWSGAMILPLSLFMLLLKDSNFYFNKHQNNFNLSFLSFLVFVVIVFICRKPNDEYRESPRKELTETFVAKELKNIKSTAARVSVTDSLLSFMRQNIKSHESLFIVGPVPLFYYLLNKKPVITNIWTCPPKEFEKWLLSTSTIDYFLIPKNDPREYSWPNSGIYPVDPDIEMVQFYLKYINEKRYKIKYENTMFYIYAAPELTAN